MTPEDKFAGIDLKFIGPDELETVEECDYVMFEIDGIVASIKEQLGRARSELARTGNYGDSDWYRAAERALRSAGRTRSLAQNKRGVLSRRERRATATANERAFIDAARSVLDRETYLKIWDVAAADARSAGDEQGTCPGPESGPGRGPLGPKVRDVIAGTTREHEGRETSDVVTMKVSGLPTRTPYLRPDGEEAVCPPT